jgi:hypothetical protein
MATIEEIRSEPEDSLALRQISSEKPTAQSSPILYCIHPAWDGWKARETHSPDDVVLRITNGFNQDILWATADGQLHFGEQALEGLTRHVFNELRRLRDTRILDELGEAQKMFDEPIPGQAYGIVEPSAQPAPARNPFQKYDTLE